jgi:hypothetical protein
MSEPRYITRYASQEAFPVIKQRSFKFSIPELHKRTEQNYLSVTMCHSLGCGSDTEKEMAKVVKSCNDDTKSNRQKPTNRMYRICMHAWKKQTSAFYTFPLDILNFSLHLNYDCYFL